MLVQTTYVFVDIYIMDKEGSQERKKQKKETKVKFKSRQKRSKIGKNEVAFQNPNMDRNN